MSFRYRRSIKILPGVRVNLSKSGVSTSIGSKGATINISKKGTTLTTGIPGSGISYRKKLDVGTKGSEMEGNITTAVFACPDCGCPTRRGKRPIWPIAVSVLLFPFGLLALLFYRRKPVHTCPECGRRW